MKQVTISDSFQWAKKLFKILKQYENDGVSFYEVVASHADVKNRNKRIYTSDELKSAAASLSERPININHDPRQTLPFPENQVLAARYEEGLVECIIQIADPQVNKMIEDGTISKVSIEGWYLDETRNTIDTEYPTSLHFKALALLTRDDEPGDPNAEIIKDSLSIRIPGEIMEKLVAQDDTWSESYISELPDDAFAYVEPTTQKDEQGKSTPRSMRHFPYKDKNGKPDPSHVRNALARLSQSNLPPQAKGAARKRLAAAAKQVGIKASNQDALESLEKALDDVKVAQEMELDAEEDTAANPLKEKPGEESLQNDIPSKNVKSFVVPQDPKELPEPKNESVSLTKSTAPDLYTALKNAGPNYSSNVEERKKSSDSVVKMSEQEKVVKEPVAQPIQISVKLEGAQELKEATEKMALIVKEAEKKDQVKPQALLANTEAGQSVEESREVKESKRFTKIAEYLRGMRQLREDISSTVAAGALGQVWQPDMVVLPTDLPANLRRFVQVKVIERGADRVNFTTITTPSFASLTEDTAPGDVTQTITQINATPTETGAKQRISYVTMESATPDVVQAVERSFQAAALIDEDNTILTALDAATPAASLYGDESVTVEANITSAMTFKGARLASAMREIQKKGYALNPGDLIAVLHPVQYDALLKDSAISQYLYFGSVGPIQQGVVPQVYGVDIVRSSRVPTGLGSGSITTYHAQVFLKSSAKGDPNGIGSGGAAALGVNRSLMIEVFRKIDERDLMIVASHRLAGCVLQPNGLVKIYTA
ncbi:MAG: phage major capsid protein [Nitrososphaerales archaeon]